MQGDGSASDSEALKVPPHDLEAEQAVLGGLMLDNAAWDQVADRLHEEDFYRREHRLVYRAMGELAEGNHPMDVVTLSGWLRKQGRLEEAGGLSYLGGIARETPSAANIRAYADIVRERSVLRQLIRAGSDVAEAAFRPEGRSSEDLLDYAEQTIFQIAEQTGRHRQGFVGMRQLMPQVIDRIDTLYNTQEAVTGLATGFDDLDHLTSGLQDGDLVIVAGRPSMGKTTVAMNMVEHVAMQLKKPVAVFSMEMPADALAMRMLASLGRVHLQRVRSGKLQDDDWPRLTSTMSLLAEAPLFIDDSPGLTPTEIRARARRLQREHDELGLIVIDYLQLMQIPGFRENRAGELSEISRGLKALAKELNTPVIALSQLNRSLEQRPNKRPIMSDLRECVTGDTPVLLADGRRTPISELVGEEPEVIAANERHRLVRARAEKVWCVGRRPVYRVQLASGRGLRATGRHRLLTASGWQRVDELSADDRIAIARTASEPQRDQESDLFWDSLVAVEPDGEEDVYDLTVPGPASWVADSIVSHNSGAIEQDADLIAFIYRDEVYNEDTPDKGVAELIIAKQRQGPIGTVKLTFLGEFTRFENYIEDVYGGGIPG